MSFILISLWADAINKFYYGTMGFNRNSAADALLLAGVITFVVGVLITIAPNNDN